MTPVTTTTRGMATTAMSTATLPGAKGSFQISPPANKKIG